MTNYIIRGVDLGMTKPVWLERRGRRKGALNADAERKAEVIKRAVAALVDENYVETAAKFQDEFYGEASVENDGSASNYERRRNQQRNVAKKIRANVRNTTS